MEIKKICCPFCGGDEFEFDDGRGFARPEIQGFVCLNCGAGFPMDEGDTKETALSKAWKSEKWEIENSERNTDDF